MPSTKHQAAYARVCRHRFTYERHDETRNPAHTELSGTPNTTPRTGTQNRNQMTMSQLGNLLQSFCIVHENARSLCHEDFMFRCGFWSERK